MKPKFMVLAAASGALFLFAAEPGKKEPSELDKLKAKVTLLEGRVNQLEARLLSLAQTPRTAFEIPSGLPERLADVPPNKGEIEVNGVKVYKVPLSISPE